MSAENKAFIHAKTGNVVLPRGRILWNSVFKPRKSRDGEGDPKYEFNLLFGKDADLSVAKEQAMEAGKDKHSKAFREAAGKWPKSLLTPFKRTADNDKLVAALEAADLKVEDFPVYMGMKSKEKPGVVGPNGKVVDDEEQVYSGRWARATVDFFGYDNKSKGVSAGLKNIQLLDNDDDLVVGGGRVSPETEFDAVEGAGDDSKSSDSLFD